MLKPKRLLLIAAAGIATTAGAVLFMTDSVLAPSVLYTVLAVTLLAAGAGIGSVQLASPATTRRSSLLSVVAFATGMTLATIAFALYTQIASFKIEDHRHRVAWPLFAIVFITAILLGVAAFSTATFVTSAIVHHRHSKRSRLDT